MPVSFRLTHHALGRQEMCAEIDQITSLHFPGQKFILVSHSYGSVISTHLLKTPSIAERIGPLVLMDPVSILLHLPDVAYNFTRRQPERANEHQLYYFASMDIGVSHTLARHFFWNENVLWKKDIEGRKLTVSLGGRDLIVNTEAVGRYLSSNEAAKRGYENGFMNGNGNDEVLIDIESDEEIDRGMQLRGGEGTKSDFEGAGDEEWKCRPWKGSGIDVLWFPDLDHAQVFDKKNTRRRVIQAIHEYCEADE
jgi:pimeloyl-ACP methyl ester carboxylesterase